MENSTYTQKQLNDIIRKRLSRSNARMEALELELSILQADETKPKGTLKFAWLGKLNSERRKARKVTR